MQQDGSTRSEKRLAFVAAIVAGACWGVSFLAPRALAETSSATIALFRFLFFAASSLFALGIRRGRRPRMTVRTAGIALGLSLAGFSLYYALLAFGVKGVGITFATAIIALLPLTILLASTPRQEWKRLGVPILLIAGGGILIPIELFGPAYSAFLERTPFERWLGLFATLAAVGLWTLFAVLNSRFLKRHSAWNPLDWAGVLGIAAGMTALLLFGAVERSAAPEEFMRALMDPRVLLWTGFMGIAGAWFAIALWNYASRVLPAGALGMLLVFEAVFGLAFGFLYDHRGPTLREGVAATCLIVGALLGIQLLSKPNDKSNNAQSGWAS
jgi:drug/metabolite transporter (DMT)-like permease